MELQDEESEALLPLSPTTANSWTRETTTTAILARSRRLPCLVLKYLHLCLIFMIPSFLRRSSSPNPLSEKTQHAPTIFQKRSTDWLDGVRGLASFIVFVFHWSRHWFPGMLAGYNAVERPSLWLLPGIRFLYSGSAMVAIFFVLSGYVLTHRFVLKMYARDTESLYAGLTSLTFRRAIRLFLPALASCVLGYMAASLGLLSIPKKVEGKAFEHGLSALLHYADMETTPWTWNKYMTGFYNAQLWSIAVEYRGSLVIFLMVLGLARTRTTVRVFVELLVIAHAFGHTRWDVALFIAGLCIAELDVYIHKSKRRTAFMQKKRIKLILFIMIGAGVFLAGFPREHALDSMGYSFTKNLWPYSDYRRRFWLAISSILIVAPLPFLPGIQSFFATGPMRYLGKVSYALYLIHGLGNKTVGFGLRKIVFSIIGKEGYWTFASSYVVTSLLYLPILLWWTDMYWRAFDMPSTTFAKWIETKSTATVQLPEE